MGRERDSRENLEVRTFGACDWALGSGVSGLLGSATRKRASKNPKVVAVAVAVAMAMAMAMAVAFVITVMRCPCCSAGPSDDVRAPEERCC